MFSKILQFDFFLMHRPPGKLDFIDHVVGNQPDMDMEKVAKWYIFT